MDRLCVRWGSSWILRFLGTADGGGIDAGFGWQRWKYSISKGSGCPGEPSSWDRRISGGLQDPTSHYSSHVWLCMQECCKGSLKTLTLVKFWQDTECSQVDRPQFALSQRQGRCSSEDPGGNLHHQPCSNVWSWCEKQDNIERLWSLHHWSLNEWLHYQYVKITLKNLHGDLYMHGDMLSTKLVV